MKWWKRSFIGPPAVHLVLLFILFAVGILYSATSHALTTVPTKMNFQGRLTNSSGNIMADGTYNMRLKLFTVSSGGSNVWNEDRLVSNTQGVQVTNGLFSVQLGDITPLSASLFASGALYLEVELPTPGTATSSSPSWTEGAMTPRNQLATSAYAYNAETLDGLDSSALGQLSASNTWSGTNLFKPSSNSASALEVQNLSSQSILKVGTLDSGNVTLFGANIGETSSWSTATNTLPGNSSDGRSVVSNGYLYHIGGIASSGAVYYAKINADGSVGTWTTASNPVPVGRSDPAVIAANGYLYHIGGYASATSYTTVYYAKLNADGSVGAWQTAANSLPAGRDSSAVTYANGYIYIMGGYDDTTGNLRSTVYSTKVNADGSVGSWSTLSSTPLPAVRAGAYSVTANGYVYVIGGLGLSFNTQSNMFYAKLNADGTLGSWSTNGTSLPSARQYGASGLANGYVYVMGGFSDNGTTRTNTVYYAKINSSDASIGSWSTSSYTLPAVRGHPAWAVANGRAYVLGGTVSGGVTTNTVYYSRLGGAVEVAGSLDLIGLSGQNLSDPGTLSNGSMGGSITAGNITAVGTMQIQGGAYFASDASVSGNFNAANLLSVDVGSSNLTIGSSTDGSIFSSTGVQYKGTARATRTVTLVPEYAGATFTPISGNFNGSLSSDFCSSTSILSVNTSICNNSTDEHNYYAWTTTQASAQDYGIYVRYKVPSDYDTGSMSNLKYWGRGTTSSEVAGLIMYKGSTACTTVTDIVTSATTWSESTTASPLGACSIAADDIVTFKISLTATQNNAVQVGEISFTYRSKF